VADNITLSDGASTIILPDMLWSDEFAWSRVVHDKSYTLSGALTLQSSERQSGRPITLSGGLHTTWITRAELLALMDLLDAAPTTGLTLTLLDDRTFTVLGQHDGGSPVDAEQLPKVLESGIADATAGTLYVLYTLRLISID
jgi:hypothetical protein